MSNEVIVLSSDDDSDPHADVMSKNKRNRNDEVQEIVSTKKPKPVAVREQAGPSTVEPPGASKHLAPITAKRLTKELQRLQEQSPPGMKIDAPSLDRWVITMLMPAGTVYSGEQHKLQFSFDNSYPLSAPEVIFLRPAPVHPHVYSNGHICLSTLATDWSPALTGEAISISIQSMLSSCSKIEKKRPDGDARYVRSVGDRSPKLTKWAFHDEKC
jgi:ubiquitin-conjugating enzyme E2 W